VRKNTPSDNNAMPDNAKLGIAFFMQSWCKQQNIIFR